MNYFITAIGTDSGKTFVSAILCEALAADYWKPIQAGPPHDSTTIRKLITNENVTIHPEAYVLNTPASPHAAALLDGITIHVNDIKLPNTKNRLIIEGAGGCLVPLNNEEFVIDLISYTHAQTILVANLYLGSINHTLLTVEALKKRNVFIKGIIFNGASSAESERIILLHSQLPCLLRIEQEHNIDKDTVKKYATLLLQHWND